MKTNNQKGSVIAVVEIVAIVALIVIGGIYYISNKSEVYIPENPNGVSEVPDNRATSSPANPIACTMEAKMCPDGSYVGRIGPNCEFRACPSSVASSIIILSPNGGERMNLESMQYITWRTSGTILPQYRIKFLINDQPLVGVNPSGLSVSSVVFQIPKQPIIGDRRFPNLSPGQYKIRAELYDGDPCFFEPCTDSQRKSKLIAKDESDNYFTITN